MSVRSPQARVWPTTALNVCIYCQRRDVKLETEHVFPEGLAGTLKLFRASCRRCADLIHPVETYCIKNTFEQMRPWLKIKSKRKHKAFPRKLTVSRKGGENGTWEIATEDDFPYALTLLRLNTPGILRGRPPGEDLETDGMTFLTSAEFGERMVRLGPNPAISFNFRPGYLTRFLAKIAHGCAVADRGLDGFRPCLPPFIKGEDPSIGPAYFVGSLYEPGWDSTEELHWYDTREVDWKRGATTSRRCSARSPSRSRPRRRSASRRGSRTPSAVGACGT